jgi:hypothetical protein
MEIKALVMSWYQLLCAFSAERSSPNLPFTPAACLFCLGHTSDSAGELSDSDLMQGQNCMKDVQKFPVCPVTSNGQAQAVTCDRTSFEQLTRFLYIPFLHYTFTIHFNGPPLTFQLITIFSFGRFVTNHMSQVAGFFLFMCTLSDCTECKMKDTKLIHTYISLTYRRN